MSTSCAIMCECNTLQICALLDKLNTTVNVLPIFAIAEQTISLLNTRKNECFG